MPVSFMAMALSSISSKYGADCPVFAFVSSTYCSFIAPMSPKWCALCNLVKGSKSWRCLKHAECMLLGELSKAFYIMMLKFSPDRSLPVMCCSAGKRPWQKRGKPLEANYIERVPSTMRCFVCGMVDMVGCRNFCACFFLRMTGNSTIDITILKSTSGVLWVNTNEFSS